MSYMLKATSEGYLPHVLFNLYECSKVGLEINVLRLKLIR
jgi:hypothetical protein